MNGYTIASLLMELRDEIAVSPENGAKGISAAADRLIRALWEAGETWAEEARRAAIG